MPITDNGRGLTVFVPISLNSIESQRTPVVVGTQFFINPNDNVVYINNQTGGAVSVNLDNHAAAFQDLIIKDVAGNAGTFNITVSALVDGTNNPILGVNYGGAWLTWNGSGWWEHA